MIGSPFRLRSTVSESTIADKGDTLNAKRAFGSLGYYKPQIRHSSKQPDDNLFESIRRFQTDNGLKRDGVMKPSGETERTLGGLLAERQKANTQTPSLLPTTKPMKSLLDRQPTTRLGIMPGEHDWQKQQTLDIARPERPQRINKQGRDIRKLLDLITRKARDNDVVAESARTVKAALKASDQTDLAKFHATAVKEFGDDALAEIADFNIQLKAANPKAHHSWLRAFTEELPDDAERMMLAGSVGDDYPKGGADDDTQDIENQSRLSEETVGVPPRKPETPKSTPVAITGAVPPFDNPVYRQDSTDVKQIVGHPEFGAGRKNEKGLYNHKGVDLRAAPGKEVRSPIGGTISKIGQAYPDGSGYRTVWVRTKDGHEVGMFYVTPHDINGNQVINKGDTVKTGQVLGTMQDLTKNFSGMDNHLHLEIRKDGRVLDPTPWLEEWGVKYPQ